LWLIEKSRDAFLKHRIGGSVALFSHELKQKEITAWSMSIFFYIYIVWIVVSLEAMCEYSEEFIDL
jgi:hypothetical protein